MTRGRVLVFAAGAVVLLGTGCAQTATGRAHPVLRHVSAGAAGSSGRATSVPGTGAAGSWGRATSVPGLAALDKGREAEVKSVSCAAPGSCAAVGWYIDGGGHHQGFVVSERNGRWRQAVGLVTVNPGGTSGVSSVSCGSPGFCAAVGFYKDGRGEHQGFVVNEESGVWGTAVGVPGLAALNTGGNAEVSSVSCAAPGSCAVAGFYTDGGGHQQGFVAVERDGAWGRAAGAPGLGARNTGGSAVNSVSCASPGNCAAGGYTFTRGAAQAFVVSETNGRWGTAQEVGANLNAGGSAGVGPVSCFSPGNCAAGGGYTGPGSQAFVINEVNGTWGNAQEVAGNVYLPEGGSVDVLSCPSAGNCSAGGTYADSGHDGVLLVGEKNGVWGPGISLGWAEYLTSLSCASAGNCAAGGGYETSGAWVAMENNGVWGKETTVPGLDALTKGPDVSVSSVSCPSAGSCVAGGDYQETGGHHSLQGFVT